MQRQGNPPPGSSASLFANGLGFGKPVDFAQLAAAPWFGPSFTTPTFQADAIFLIAPVAVILVAENLGHIKAVGAMTGRSLVAYLGRTLFADSLATIVAHSNSVHSRSAGSAPQPLAPSSSLRS